MIMGRTIWNVWVLGPPIYTHNVCYGLLTSIHNVLNKILHSLFYNSMYSLDMWHIIRCFFHLQLNNVNLWIKMLFCSPTKIFFVIIIFFQIGIWLVPLIPCNNLMFQNRASLFKKRTTGLSNQSQGVKYQFKIHTKMKMDLKNSMGK